MVVSVFEFAFVGSAQHKKSGTGRLRKENTRSVESCSETTIKSGKYFTAETSEKLLVRRDRSDRCNSNNSCSNNTDRLDRCD